MATYRVFGKTSVTVSIVVEANTPEEAIECADEEFGGINGFCGNGGADKLIGVYGSNESIEEDGSEIEWFEAEPSDGE
jgi:hypothetical protein